MSEYNPDYGLCFICLKIKPNWDLHKYKGTEESNKASYISICEKCWRKHFNKIGRNKISDYWRIIVDRFKLTTGDENEREEV